MKIVVARHHALQEEQADQPHQEGRRAAQEQLGVKLLLASPPQQG
jgi:hypothetical protein